MATTVQFIKDYDFTSFDDPNVTICYKAGYFAEVSEECALRATLAGCALVQEGFEAQIFIKVDSGGFRISGEDEG